jgi:hypothetical protein
MTMIDRVVERWLNSNRKASESFYFIGIFLAPMSQQRLVKRFGQEHSQRHATHMTIWTSKDGGSEPDVSVIPWGKTVAMKVIGYAVDDRGQAVLVQPPSRFRPLAGRTPHVTISTALGVPAAYSNVLVQDRDARKAIPGAFLLEGRAGWSDGETESFSLPYWANRIG